MHQVVVGVDHPVVQVRGLLAVVEEHHLVGAVIDLRVRRHTPVRRESAVEGGLAERVGGAGIDAVEVAALIETRQCGAAVHHDVGTRGVFEQGSRTPAMVDFGQRQGFGQSRPQRTAGGVLGLERLGAHKPVAVERFSVPEADDVQHGITVERVVGLQRRVQWILGVAQIDPVEVGGDLAVDHRQIVSVPFSRLRPPRSGSVRVVIVVGQGGQELADDLNVHDVPHRSCRGRRRRSRNSLWWRYSRRS